jgi:cobalamin biosynthesis protein CobT
VFSRREIKEAERASVYILVDCSGSMYDMMGRAQTLTIQLAKMLEKAKVNYAVRGFYGHTSIVSNEVIFREEVTQIQFKNWNESLTKASLKMGSIHNAACGSTPEYSGLYCAIEELSKRPDPKKVLFFLTDADGFDVENIQHLEDLSEKLGVKIVAVGIDSPDVTRAFKQAVNVRDASDLGGASFRALLKTVR